MTYSTTKTIPDSPLDWRKHLPIHPAAELLPLMSEAELKELAKDIKKHGLRTQIVLWTSKNPKDKWEALLDGRNRLDAAALAGLLCVDDYDRLSLMNGDGTPFEIRWRRCDDDDPYAIALSYNIHRRHLTSERKRELIAKVLKAKPAASNRQIAKQVKADDKTVGKVRTELEATAEIPQLKKRAGADGKSRKQPAKRKAAASAEVGTEQRKAEMAALAGATDPRAAEDAKYEAGGKKVASVRALADFKFSCRTWLPKMTAEHRHEAIAYCAGFAKPRAGSSEALPVVAAS